VEDVNRENACADVILKEYRPFNMFVYANMDTKLKRCMECTPKGEKLTNTEFKRKIREIDKEHTKYWNFYTGTRESSSANYHLCINTSGNEIKK